MPRVPYRNRRNKAYRALLTTVARSCQLPPHRHDEQCVSFGVTVAQVEEHIHGYDWRQLKYLMDTLVRDGLAYKLKGRRGVRALYWPVGGLQVLKRKKEIHNA